MNTVGPATSDAMAEAGQPDRSPPPERRTRRTDAVLRRISMAACLFAAACGGADDSEPEPGPEPVAWQDMSIEERTEYMTDVVMPRMKEVFVAYDPKFESMDCETCHGDGVANGSYAMPSAGIAPLPGSEEGFLEWVGDPEHPERQEWTNFMFDKVVPEMADLLQIPRFDPTTQTGEFSCNYCHMLEGAEP
ncbi:hypothetical protein WME89_25545 [Sorangium sp. So ce321]|uniref:hypothetical protein n=1 Tax=Sorangium sp. So ce321 TaxID=3133300 RepID=UPI003F60F63F